MKEGPEIRVGEVVWQLEDGAERGKWIRKVDQTISWIGWEDKSDAGEDSWKGSSASSGTNMSIRDSPLKNV